MDLSTQIVCDMSSNLFTCPFLDSDVTSRCKASCGQPIYLSSTSNVTREFMRAQYSGIQHPVFTIIQNLNGHYNASFVGSGVEDISVSSVSGTTFVKTCYTRSYFQFDDEELINLRC